MVDKRSPKIPSCSSQILIPDVTWENDSLNVHNPSSSFQNTPKPYICCISEPFPEISDLAHPRGSPISEMPGPDQFSKGSLFLFLALNFWHLEQLPVISQKVPSQSVFNSSKQFTPTQDPSCLRCSGHLIAIRRKWNQELSLMKIEVGN